jgi:hypothetical protein
MINGRETTITTDGVCQRRACPGQSPLMNKNANTIVVVVGTVVVVLLLVLVFGGGTMMNGGMMNLWR